MTTELPLAPLEPGGSILGDEVYAVLGAAIRDGVLAPGQRVRDVDVAEALGVSRTPVREALQRLARIGLVEVSASRYTRVAEHDTALLREAQEYVIYSIGIAMRMALQHSSDDEIAELLCRADALVAASENGEHQALVDASSRLFQQISGTTGNRVFRKIMQEAGPFFQRTMEPWTPRLTDADERTKSFRDLADAIADRDGDRAERLLRRLHGI